jgi:chorismate dehydratase
MIKTIGNAKFKVGMLPYLNVRPLGHGLAEDNRVEITTLRPSEQAERLDAGLLDVAVVPVVDFLAHRDHWHQAVPLGICCRAAVWTVKLFSPVPLEQIERVTVDLDSHTSVNLLRVLFHESQHRLPILTGRNFSPIDPGAITEPTLLIGDKAWQGKAPYVYDFGQWWYDLFKLPFVFAMWVSAHPIVDELKTLLVETAERNFRRTDELARTYGPPHGFSIADARTYFDSVIRYRIGPDELAGLEHFAECLDKISGAVPCRE